MRGKNIRTIKKRDEPFPVPVATALADYFATTAFKRLRKATQTNYHHFLGTFANWCGCHAMIQGRDKSWQALEDVQGIALHEVDDQVIFAFLEHLKESHKPSRADRDEVTSWTLATYTKRIKTFLNWCVLDEEYSSHVQATTVAWIKPPKVQQEVIETFTNEEIAALFAACDKEESEHLAMRDRAILSLLLDSGIRNDELVTVTMGNVFLATTDAYIQIEGKGGKYGQVGLGDQARRTINKYIKTYRQPTVEAAVRLLHTRLPEAAQKQAERAAFRKAPLFVGRYGEPLTTSGLYQLVRRLARWAGVERCFPHRFRHTFALYIYRKTRDIKRVSQLLRHSSVAVTETYLRGLMQSEARRGAPSILDELDV